MSARAAVSSFLLFVGALIFLSPDKAYAHEPAGGRDCSAYPYAPPFPSVPRGRASMPKLYMLIRSPD